MSIWGNEWWSTYGLWYSHMHTPKGYFEQKKWENKGIFLGPEVYEAFYDLAVGIHVNCETEFGQHIDHLFGPLAFC